MNYGETALVLPRSSLWARSLASLPVSVHISKVGLDMTVGIPQSVSLEIPK
ncbi:unnamed protein product, partial [Heterobilharzia americana]